LDKIIIIYIKSLSNIVGLGHYYLAEIIRTFYLYFVEIVIESARYCKIVEARGRESVVQIHELSLQVCTSFGTRRIYQ
jgi:hypothetical protein